MRIVFMGTPTFAVPSLRAVAAEHDVSLVVTRPDAVRGRGKRLEPSPVKEEALRLGIEALEAHRIGPDEVGRIAQEKPDVICVAAYGAILPNELLLVPALDIVNVHASLLPHGRGAAPIQRAVLEGDELAGVSIMRIVHELDAGPYCAQASVPIGSKSCAEVMAQVAELGAKELVGALSKIATGNAVWTAQDEGKVSYAAKLQKAEMLLDPADDALTNARRVQASLDAAPARAVVCGRGVRVMEACVSPQEVARGEVLAKKGRVFLGCAKGSLEVLSIKPDGKRQMPASAWASGLRKGELRWERV